jgi:F420-dependent hydroxymycolic acid dehydrogenase
MTEAAELWRFGPKAWKSHFNIRDPKTIQDRGDAEIPLEKVTEDGLSARIRKFM